MSWLEELKRMAHPAFWNEWSLKRRLEQNTEAVLRTVGLGSGQRVLDYGCGSGAFAIPAARIVGEEGKVYALDISSKALAKVKDRAAREGLGNIEALLSEGKGVPGLLEGESFDVVLLYDVLHLIEDKTSLLRELHKMLEAQGFLSVDPMHLREEEIIELTGRDNLFILRDQHERILNFVKRNIPSRPRCPKEEG